MLHVESINHLYDGLGPLLKHTHVVGDPLSQDWIICPHLMMCKWVQEQIALQKEICVQIDAFSLSEKRLMRAAAIWEGDEFDPGSIGAP